MLVDCSRQASEHLSGLREFNLQIVTNGLLTEPVVILFSNHADLVAGCSVEKVCLQPQNVTYLLGFLIFLCAQNLW